MLDAATAPAPSFRSFKERIARRDILFPARAEDVARLCCDHPELLAFDSTGDIARRAGVSSSTVLRFIAMIGFSNIKTARRIFQDEIRLRSQVRSGAVLQTKIGMQSSTGPRPLIAYRDNVKPTV